MKRRRVHLDFHTSEKIENLGIDFSKKQFQAMLKRGHVNSITLFSKCHHGWAYHPTQMNEIHPGLKFDLLGQQIEAAHEIGVETPVYLSAGLDEKIARRHPEWICRKKDEMYEQPDFSQPGYHRICFNTPYLEYLLNQIKEVCERYEADGIFLDIVGETPCYCENCKKILEERGLSVEDEVAVKALAVETYAKYTDAVRKTIDSVKYGLPVFHNSGHIETGRRDIARMNTHLELESLPTGGWGYDHFPMSAAYARTLNMDFCGMTGKFHTSWGEFGGYKHPNALKYEIALSSANGAACSIGDQLHPKGHFDEATYQLIGEAYEYLEKREEFLDGMTNTADIAFISNEAYRNYASKKKEIVMSNRNSLSDIGCARILLENHFLFDMIDLEEDFQEYKMLILPDNIVLDEKLEKRIKHYIANGGKVLLSYKSGMDLEENEFILDTGCQNLGMSEYVPSYIRPEFEIDSVGNAAFVIYCEQMKVKNIDGESLAKTEKPYFNRSAEAFCSHKHTPTSGDVSGEAIIRKGNIVYISYKIFEEYANVGSITTKEIVAHIIELLLEQEQSVKASLPSQGIVTMMESADKKRQILHLLYASPVKRGKNIEVIEDMIPLYNIEVSVKAFEEPQKVVLLPEGDTLDFKYEKNHVYFKVPKMECWQMIGLVYK